MTKTVRAIFWSAMPSNANFLRSHDKNLRFATLGKTFGRSVLELGSPPPVPTLSIHAKPALISGMDFHQKWTKTKGRHGQIQIQVHRYKYKYTNTNTNSHIQIQIQTQGGAPKSNFDIRPTQKRFYENGHISGTVRPTPLQHPSNRSSLRARQEKRHRGSLTCPGNTGEPEAPVLGSNRHIELGPEAKKWLRQKGQFFGLLCPQTQICWGRTSKIFDLAPWEPLLDAPFLS